MVVELNYEKARRNCTTEIKDCASTAELEPLQQIIGQDRAVKALHFGLKMRDEGFNIYVSGMSGTGRKTTIASFLQAKAKEMPIPPDWCYVNNFKDPTQPNALKLPAGKGKAFRDNMDKFTEDVKKELQKAFESEDYAQKRASTVKKFDDEKAELWQEINQKANQAGFILQRSPIGMAIIPVINDKPIADEQFATLPPKIKEQIRTRRESLQDDFRSAFRQFRDLDKGSEEAVDKFNKEVATFAMDHLLEVLLEKYSDITEVKEFLDSVKNDILENLPTILTSGQPQQQPALPFLMPGTATDPTSSYKVNLIVDNSDLKGAPVITEMSPTQPHLFGIVQKEARFGALLTDYTMIRAGSAHKANGGFLIIPVEDLLMDAIAWDSLKKTITSRKLSIEDIAQRLGYIATKTMTPEPIPFDVKVILIGSPDLYYALHHYDRDFKEIFKVKADFDTTMERNEENINMYASFICNICKKDNLRHLDSSGIAAVIEYSSRLAEDQSKLSTWFAQVADIIKEAAHYAKEEGAEYTTGKHIEKALEEKVYRSNLIEQKMEKMIEEGTILVDTAGEKIGQINGLSVLGLGDFAFGKPSRITVSVGVGKKGIIDIEREAQMGGPIHTKGVQILSGFLNDRYAKEFPLSLTARLVFEQSYSGVEGDSASSTELYGILSALSRKPIKQHFAVTGSVNQKGEVQAIGGVNEKLEGYFQLCKARGLDGEHGVVIPASNVKNLMLKHEVVDAIKSGQFHVFPVSTIDEGIEVLTGVKAGVSGKDCKYPAGTINCLVQDRLASMAEKVKGYSEE
ncbi:ATP-dependent protease [Candidatus Bathyarchaeota archaeon RBG_13_52_12]|nr:MAG: ATP-dependent protease [Candidatus Bathyarchaeota archaeon RBG_13_52_12]